MVADVKEAVADERMLLRTDPGALVTLATSPTTTPLQSPQSRGSDIALYEFGRRQFVRVRGRLTELIEAEIAFGTPFNFGPVFMAIGSIVYFAMASEPGFYPIAIVAAIAIAATIVSANQLAVAYAVAVVAALCAGMMFAKIETFSRETILLGEQITTRITGRVLSLGASPNGARAVVEVLSTERPQLKFQPLRVKVTLRKVPEGLAPGDGIRALFLLRPPSGPVRPGSFDFGFDSYFDRIGASGVSLSPIERVVVPAPGIVRQWMFWLERQRVAIAERIRSSISGQSGEMSAALITGLGSGLDPSTSEAMRASGLAHVTSISGLHMALVAGSMMGMIRLVLALFPNVASRYPTKKIAACFGLFGAFGYLLLSGGGVATLRSFIMLAVMLIAMLFDRAAISMRNLVCAAIVILAFAPHEVMGPSFQMSFAATAALIASYQMFSSWRTQRGGSHAMQLSLVQKSARVCGLFLLALLATSLVAGLATSVYSAYHFNRVAPMGLPANLIAMPVVSIIVMPMALLSMMLMPFGLEAAPLWLMGKGVDFMLATAHRIAEVSGDGEVGTIPASAFALYSLSLLAFCLLNTRLRLASLPIALLATVLVFTRTVPDIAISEDAKLIAARGGSGLSLNQLRPNRFTLDNWRRAYQADVNDGETDSFVCKDGFCVVRHRSGARLGHLTDKTRLQDACGSADFLVIAFPVGRQACAGKGAFVVTARQLARQGAAEVQIGRTNGALHFIVTQAFAGLERPWQRHRLFSRASRNMEPYVSKRPKVTAKPALDAVQRAN